MPIITFGKYKNRENADVYGCDKSYIKWLSNNTMLLEAKPEINDFIQNIKPEDLVYRMNWGKYKNSTLQWIYQNDSQYFDWLSKSDYVLKNCQKLNDEIKRVQSSYES